ncbi:uncharacterized protein LOC143189888, partial [Rhynchophorus ferrugineus]|uniref:uncharacterized protein LOC143189888 n=1 Tax=Rhynchophorus ferrugineus TaxID=354439 RepID=UPI003FCD4C04
FPGRSCNRFVHCWGGNVIELSCPDGLHFSKFGFCDYPVSAGCDDSDFPERNVQEQSPCPQESGIFRNESHCDRYFVCSFGRILSQYQCPPGFSFSKILGTCDYSHRVDCGDALQPSNVENSTVMNLTHSSTDVSEKPSESDRRCSVVPKGYVRDSTNCSQYHLCESGVVTATYTCPTGTLYSNVLGICDFANKVNCNDSVTAPEVNNIDIGQDLSPELLAAVEKCTPGTTIPLNADCSKACRCRAHSAEIIQCTQGLAYDSALDKCVPSYIAKC